MSELAGRADFVLRSLGLDVGARDRITLPSSLDRRAIIDMVLEISGVEQS